MRFPAVLSVLALIVTSADSRADEAHQKQFDALVRPALEGFCYKCHGPEKQKGDLNLADHATYESVQKHPQLWDDIRERIMAFEMPPEGSPMPEGVVRDNLLDWLRKVPKEELDCTKLASDRTESFYRGHVMSRRLTRDEYDNTIRDLTGLDLKPGRQLPADGAGGEGFDTTGDTLFTSPLAMEKYLEAAESVALALLPDDPASLPPDRKAARDRLLCATPSDTLPARDAARAVLHPFTRLAFRRPVTDEETGKFLALYDRAASRGDAHHAALRLAITGVLVSPSFLFLAEPEPAEPGVQALPPYPLASRLSYFLWASMPDAPLLADAESGALLQDATLLAHVRRMVQDPRAAALGHRFAGQWLELDRIGTDVRPDAKRFPEFTPELAASMRTEVITYFNHLIAQNRPLLDLIDSDYTFADARLATLYGIEGVTGTGFEKITFQTRDRGGLLGMAAISTATSFPLRTSPVLRGKWLLDTILGEKVPPPPPGVPPLKEDSVNDTASLREQLEAHRKNPDCAACHNRMDPLGFGMENYDVLGRLRTAGIDASATMPNGETFTGPQGLKRILLSRKDQIMRHLVRKLTGYALGRELNRFDECIIRDAMHALLTGEYRPLGAIEAIVLSKPFRFRYYPRSETPPGQ